jgi:hypothetical protein
MKGTFPTRSGFWPVRHRSAKIEFALFNLITRGEVMEKVTTMGIDLAKSVFSLHGVDVAEQVLCGGASTAVEHGAALAARPQQLKVRTRRPFIFRCGASK